MKNHHKQFLALVFLILCTLFFNCKPKSEWIQLFNGENLEHWTVKIHHYEVGDNFGDTFRVEDGIIKIRYDNYKGDFNERYGHLYYDTPYKNYHLVIEYRFANPWYDTAPGYTVMNSGVMFHSQDPRTMPKEQDWPISVEMQFLAEVKEGESRPTGNMCSPGTDVVFEGKIDPRHCISSTSDTYPPDEWVKAELIVRGDSLITHIINGKKVLEYSKPQIGGGVANRYDESVKIDGKPLKEGFIALQSEGQPIDFRKVELKLLED
ncbi:3-keto-disaccharide hydrolase [Flagellimonas pacifica]|uniref:3-keto-alpha-glucoside-1,2-lyase/3-keto-2-hydroxy-glucal hydratase domain-containing protein n=1 Tax=Flagellimonas pacifica TaxID=1247520 RepID=A0A285MWS3_9FLAO|nr:DUF1080 domain-containing protein [Allomuricauda parva]SNZ01635.1 protein of unknown function [Allomuricauda parva]